MVLRKETGLRELALFAGAGGGILGGLLLGWRTVAAVEIEEYPRAVLLQRQIDGILPRFPVWDDVRTFDGRQWRGKVDIISGGFPCQDISSAGKGAGIEGDRSGLWKEMARIIGEVRPRYAFMENSPLLISRGLTTVLGDLAEMGYDARWCVLGADDAGGFHRRKRIWILANTQKIRCEGIKIHKKNKLYSLFDREPSGGTVSSYKRYKNAPSWVGKNSEGRWGDEPKLDRVVDVMANWVDRISAIGNGQVPAVVKLAWETLTSDID